MHSFLIYYLFFFLFFFIVLFVSLCYYVPLLIIHVWNDLNTVIMIDFYFLHELLYVSEQMLERKDL